MSGLLFWRRVAPLLLRNDDHLSLKMRSQSSRGQIFVILASDMDGNRSIEGVICIMKVVANLAPFMCSRGC